MIFLFIEVLVAIIPSILYFFIRLTIFFKSESSKSGAIFKARGIFLLFFFKYSSLLVLSFFNKGANLFCS